MESVSKSSTSSRLDRVFTLLENGTSPITRKAAAKQLGDVQKKYPRELNNLLAKLLVYVKHTEWSTRIASAEAIEAVISHVQNWNPDPAVKQESESTEFPDNKLKLCQFDVDRVLGGSALLLGSSGDEYKTKSEETQAKDRIRKQRLLLEQRLGLTLGGSTSVGVSSDDLFKDEDLIENHASEAKATAIKKEPCSSVMSQITAGMSSREKNRAKRKARSLLKQQSREQRHKQEADNKDSQPSKKRKLCKEGDKSSASVTSQAAILENVPEHQPDPNDWKEWPFEWICEELVNMLFSAAWEARHGACLALREILKRQGGGCGKVGGMTTPQLNNSHQMWLCDAAVRLLCVIALDRFADYVSDQVTAPVRESCAQTLSVVVKFMSEKHVFSTISILMRLYGQKEWEVRQSALLTLQYIVAVRQDLQSKLLPFCFPTLLSGLEDEDGDVRSVSAKALMPLTQLLVQEHNTQNLDLLLRILWDSLKTYDELTASTQSVLLLLSMLLTSLPAQKIRNIDRPEILAHRLLSFFHHASASVRQAALSTLHTMISSDPAKDVIPWLSHICVDSLWNLFQSCLLEAKASVRESACKLFFLFTRKSSSSSLLQLIPHIPLWMSLSCQPEALPIDGSLLVQTKSVSPCEDPSSDSQKLIGGARSALAPSSAGVTYAEHVTETREIVTRMISVLCCHALGGTSPETLPAVSLVTDHFTQLMTSQSALHRMAVAMVIGGWWEEISSQDSLLFPASLSAHIHSLLTSAHSESLYFSEITLNFIQVQTDVKSLLAALAQKGVPLLHDFPMKSSYNFQEVLNLCSNNFPSHLLNNDDELTNQRNHLMKLTNQTMTTQSNLDCRVKSYISSALVWAATSRQSDVTWRLAQKLNPVIRPLMDSVKSEQNQTIRSSVARTISKLLGLCAIRQPCPNTKLVRNLCTSLTSYTARCPTVHSIKAEFSDEVLESCKIARDALHCDAIITLLRQQASTASDVISKKRKRHHEEGNTQDETKQTNNATASKGAVCCLKTICEMHGGTLFKVVPNLWDKMCAFKELANKLKTAEAGSEETALAISQSLSTFEVVVPVICDPTLKEQILTLLPSLVDLLWCFPSNVRYLASRSLAVLARHAPRTVMPLFVEQVTDNFDDTDQVVRRKGAVEAVAALIDEFGVEVVPYSVLLIVPLLGRMSDHDPQVRMLATHCFAQLIQFMPVESSIPDPPNMPESLLRKKMEERRFLDQLMDIRMLEEFHVPVHIKATLRSYQQDGVKWLAFLNRFKLHGILCDDMGLGKTLQTICIVASDHHYKAKKMKESGKRRDLLSLVVCPPTLTGHWVEEVSKFCDDLIPLHYAGNPQERAKLQSSICNHNLVVASYEVVRNDVNFFSRYKWNYCVLDEGHAIRNGKSKISQCVKSLISNHRLILTGTPIQNSVLELWSLFDFLIPGFLGSEAEFNSRFTKPILASRDAKNSSKEQEEGIIALEALHRQVLPFMLRRMKEDVLKDLPPKIIQDYYCDLSPLQLQLYEDFAKSQAKKDAESTITKIDEEGDQRSLNKDASHVFQALQYLQKVCNHPLFVLSPSHPRYQRFMTQLKSAGSSLREIKHAAKLPSLRQLLLDCGIGVPADSGAEVSVLGQHRALIFCQHRNMLDIIQNDLFGALMPTVTFLRLDGAVPANQRFTLVSRFNNDPSIDVLLLTTKVGGLGLNLTGADTVVFVEHDWNPMVDLQAMDRAHRIGQKKVVNVYRLITRGTLEEKILGLQKFKLNIANTIVSDDNRGLQSMGTGQVLDLFNVDKDAEKKSRSSSNEAKSPSKGLRAMMDSLGELWDQNQYAEEYDINNFIQTLS